MTEKKTRTAEEWYDSWMGIFGGIFLISVIAFFVFDYFEVDSIATHLLTLQILSFLAFIFFYNLSPRRRALSGRIEAAFIEVKVGLIDDISSPILGLIDWMSKANGVKRLWFFCSTVGFFITQTIIIYYSIYFLTDWPFVNMELFGSIGFIMVSGLVYFLGAGISWVINGFSKK